MRRYPTLCFLSRGLLAQQELRQCLPAVAGSSSERTLAYAFIYALELCFPPNTGPKQKQMCAMMTRRLDCAPRGGILWNCASNCTHTTSLPQGWHVIAFANCAAITFHAVLYRPHALVWTQPPPPSAKPPATTTKQQQNLRLRLSTQWSRLSPNKPAAICAVCSHEGLFGTDGKACIMCAPLLYLGPLEYLSPSNKIFLIDASLATVRSEFVGAFSTADTPEFNLEWERYSETPEKGIAREAAWHVCVFKLLT